jgi:parallel beta-helix repeat protein
VKDVKSEKKRPLSPLFLTTLLAVSFLPAHATALTFPTYISAASNNRQTPTNTLSAPVTIVVPDDYPSTAAAVGNASASDTITVRKGTYFENLIIDKPLSLQGEDSTNTVLVGAGGAVGASVITIAADDVNVSGFTITSVNYSTSASYAYGVLIEGDKCAISGNNIVNTLSGIFCSAQSYTTIDRNNITGNHKDGIRFYGSFNNTITDNNITDNAASAIGIQGYSNLIAKNVLSQNTRRIGLGATYSVIYRNNLTQNSEEGIYLTGCNNILSGNYVADNKYGIYSVPSFGVSDNNTIVHNDFVNNSLNAFLTSPYNVQIWDEGYPAGGNYWSDYSTAYPNASQIDSSGIMNVPYSIDVNNTDRNPLEKP